MTKIFAAVLLLSLAITPLAAAKAPDASNLGNVVGGDFPAARGVIAKRCVRCHTAERIDAALSANKNMLEIQHEMEKRGAKLNAEESDVLGVFWKQQSPLKQKK